MEPPLPSALLSLLRASAIKDRRIRIHLTLHLEESRIDKY